MAEKTKAVAERKAPYSLSNIQDITKLATLLKTHISKHKLSQNIGGKDYTYVEGWQFAGGLMGLMPIVTEIKDLSSDKVIKWQATVEIINTKTDKIVGRGIALCSNAENKKKNFDEYAVQSMAQTRAIGKAYRNLIGWVMKMSGFEATPAEEMTPSPEKVNKMFDDAIEMIKVCKSVETLEGYREKIMGSKKYSKDQKQELGELINAQIQFVDENASK